MNETQRGRITLKIIVISHKILKLWQ